MFSAGLQAFGKDALVLGPADELSLVMSDEDAAFIIAARSSTSALIAEVRRLTAENVDLRAKAGEAKRVAATSLGVCGATYEGVHGADVGCALRPGHDGEHRDGMGGHWGREEPTNG